MALEPVENVFQYADRMQRQFMPASYGKPKDYETETSTKELVSCVQAMAVDKTKSARFRVAAIEEKRHYATRLGLSADQLSRVNSEIDAAEKTVETEAAGQTGGTPEQSTEVNMTTTDVKKEEAPAKKWYQEPMNIIMLAVGVGAVAGIVYIIRK